MWFSFPPPFWMLKDLNKMAVELFTADFESLAAEQQMFHDMNSSTRDTPVSNLHHSCAQCRKLVLSAGHKNEFLISTFCLSNLVRHYIHSFAWYKLMYTCAVLLPGVADYTYINCHIHLHVYRCSIWLCLTRNWRLVVREWLLLLLLIFY